MAMLHKNAFAQNRNCTISFLFPLGHISGSVFVINCLSSQVSNVKQLPTTYTNPNTSSQMSLVMFGQEGRHAAILEAIEKFRVSVAIITLALAADLLQNEELCTRYNLSSLKSIYFSGSRLPEHFSLGLISKLGVRVYEVYGATEFMVGYQTLPTLKCFVTKRPLFLLGLCHQQWALFSGQNRKSTAQCGDENN